MANSLLDIKPHVVSRSLRGYSVLLYGEPKAGKTTIASKFPGALLLAFEKGYNAIPGVMAKPINSWTEFRKVLNELKDPQVKTVFQTVVLDTADIAYTYCEKYICNRESDNDHDYQNIGDIPYGGGYKLAQQEFDECIRKILQLDYGLVLISHSQDKTFKDEQGNEFSKIIPTLDNKGRLVCERTCDIIGYARGIQQEDGTVIPKLFLRGTPRFVAGGRFKYIEPVIDLNYDALTKAIADAVDKEAAELDNKYVTDDVINLHIEEEKPLVTMDEVLPKFQEVVGKLMEKNQSNGVLIQKIVGKYLGAGRKVSDCTDDQADIVELIIDELKQI